MKISYHWLKNYLNINLAPEKVGEILTSIGLELEGIETYERIKGGLEGLLVGEVMSCEKHPDADRLSVTKVDIGSTEPLSIVCGAPNVAKGQKVIVATVGTKLYPIEGEPFSIKKGKIRGETSEGMICAQDEIGLGNDHSGIMILPNDTPTGMAVSDYFKVEKDYIFEIGLTPNRSDATSHLGVAADLAAALHINHNLNIPLQRPSVDSDGFNISHKNLTFEVLVENTKDCLRYCGVSIEGVRVAESPQWLKDRLLAIGQRPINNIVDVTNFVLHECGQPLHAFDADRIANSTIIVGNLANDTKFTTLDGVERKLLHSDLMICDGQRNGLCIAGVFGGNGSGVTETTTNIFLESAIFSPTAIRQTSSRLLLKTDAAKTFEKGADPNGSLFALKRAALLMQEIAGGKIASDVIDIYPKPVLRQEILISYKNIRNIIGVSIPKEKIHKILDALDITIIEASDEHLKVAIPTNKVDVLREVDVAEEILRIYGFDRVEVPTRVHSSLSYSPKPNEQSLRETISNYLSANGFYEMMNLSISQSKYYKNLLPFDDEKLVYINNTSNVYLDVMRPSMLISGLEVVLHNQNRQNSNLRLFEFGKSYIKTDNGFQESPHFSIFLTGQRHEETWHNTKNNTEVSFFSLKSVVNAIFKKLGINDYKETVGKNEGFAYNLSYQKGNITLAQLGKVENRITKGMDIKGSVFYADLNWQAIMKVAANNKVQYSEVTKFPSVRRDLALVLEKSVAFTEIVQLAQKTEKKILKSVNLFDVYEDDQRLGEGKKSYSVSYLFEDKEQMPKDVDKIMEKLIATYERELGATVRR